MTKKPTIPPPRPDLIRQPAGRFGWLEDRLLHEGWLARIGPNGTAVLVLLALAADRHGASFYSRRRMADALGINWQQLDAALRNLIDLQLVAHRPWRQGHPDGIWQLMPVPATKESPRSGEPVSLRQTLQSLGLKLKKPSTPNT